MKPAAFRATYSDWKLIRTRKVVQIVMEVPLELAHAAYDVLGGMPNAGEEVWCAVARLLNERESVEVQRIDDETPKEVMRNPVEQPTNPDKTPPGQTPAPSGRAAPRPFTSLPLAQQAALLCADPVFRAFLNEEYGADCGNDEAAAAILRFRCGVVSRSHLRPDNSSGQVFTAIREEFMAWKLVAA